MKRILLVLCALVLLLPLASCGPNYKTRTAEFYGNIDKTSFWYTGEVTSGKTVYFYTQAVDADSCTTIENHNDDSKDGYVIYDGTYLHSLNLSSKKYDTLKTENGVDFLCGQNEYKEYNNAQMTTDAAIFDGQARYCEVFAVVDDDGNEIGENKYYFDETRLIAIEWLENGEITATLRMQEYSNSIPEDIYVSLPEDFKAGTYTAEQVVDPWADKSDQ